MKIIEYHFEIEEVEEINLLDDGWYSVAYDISLPHRDIIIKFEIPDVLDIPDHNNSHKFLTWFLNCNYISFG